MIFTQASRCHVPNIYWCKLRLPQFEIGQAIPILNYFLLSIWQVQVCQIPLGVTPTSEVFQKKIDKLFNGLPNVVGIADILIVGINELGRDHDEAVNQILKICRKASLKHNSDKWHFRCTSFPYFGKSFCKMVWAQTLGQLFLRRVNYLSKFSPATAEVCKALRRLTLVKVEWSWNRTYQDLYDNAKKLITKDARMKFYDASKPLNLEMDASGVGLGAGLLQLQEDMNCVHDEVPNNMALHPVAFASGSVSSAEQWYSNIEREVLGILHGLEKFHHYCFGKEVHVIPDHKPLVVMVCKDVATLSQCFHYSVLCIQQ